MKDMEKKEGVPKLNILNQPRASSVHCLYISLEFNYLEEKKILCSMLSLVVVKKKKVFVEPEAETGC